MSCRSKGCWEVIGRVSIVSVHQGGMAVIVAACVVSGATANDVVKLAVSEL